MSALEIDTAQRIEQSDVPDELKKLLSETGFDFTGMNPKEVQSIADSFQQGLKDFHSSVRLVLRSDEETL